MIVYLKEVISNLKDNLIITPKITYTANLLSAEFPTYTIKYWELPHNPRDLTIYPQYPLKQWSIDQNNFSTLRELLLYGIRNDIIDFDDLTDKAQLSFLKVNNFQQPRSAVLRPSVLQSLTDNSLVPL